MFTIDSLLGSNFIVIYYVSCCHQVLRDTRELSTRFLIDPFITVSLCFLGPFFLTSAKQCCATVKIRKLDTVPTFVTCNVALSWLLLNLALVVNYSNGGLVFLSRNLYLSSRWCSVCMIKDLEWR